MSFSTEQINSPVKLYLVDDHLVLRQALAEALGNRGKYAVIGHTGSSNELLNQSPNFKADVIVLDFSLPRTNGLEVLNELRRRGIDIPVLIMSGDESGRAAKAAIQAGAKGFVPKQAGLSEMEHAIDEIVKGGTYLSPSIASPNNGAKGSESCVSSAVLSNREREIMVLLANGKPNREIGKLLSISVRTVDTHRSNILKKLGFKTNAELVKLAIAEGWVTT